VGDGRSEIFARRKFSVEQGCTRVATAALNENENLMNFFGIPHAGKASPAVPKIRTACKNLRPSFRPIEPDFVEFQIWQARLTSMSKLHIS
jgi:hypothetical protein